MSSSLLKTIIFFLSIYVSMNVSFAVPLARDCANPIIYAKHIATVDIECDLANHTTDSNIINGSVNSVSNPNKSGNNGKNQGSGTSFDSDSDYNVWLNVTHDSFSNDHVTVQYDGHANNLLFGVDRMYNDHLLLGAALGHEGLDIKTIYNNGKLNGKGWSLVPYANYIIDNKYDVDFVLALTQLKYDTFRVDPLNPVATPIGDTTASRYIARSAINWRDGREAWRWHAKGGFTLAKENRKSYTEKGTGALFQPSQSISFGRLDFGAEVSYPHNRLEPYASALLLWDIIQEDVRVAASQPKPTNDKVAVLLALGVRFNIADNIQSYIEASTETFRTDFSLTTISGYIKSTF